MSTVLPDDDEATRPKAVTTAQHDPEMFRRMFKRVYDFEMEMRELRKEREEREKEWEKRMEEEEKSIRELRKKIKKIRRKETAGRRMSGVGRGRGAGCMDEEEVIEMTAVGSGGGWIRNHITTTSV